MTSFAASLGVAGTDEEPMGPGLEPIGILELRKMPPGIQQRLLGCVLGEVRVTQNPACNRVHGIADASDELVERLFVSAHRSLDELSHILTHYGAGRDRGRSVSMRGPARRAFNRGMRNGGRSMRPPFSVGIPSGQTLLTGPVNDRPPPGSDRRVHHAGRSDR